MSTIPKVESSLILANCQEKLVEIDHKLSKIKDRCTTGKTKYKYSLHTNEDFIILKKETESLESDIQFVKTLIEETTEIQSSFAIKLMKRIFPTKMFSSQNKPVSNEIKAKIIAHSTALLEEKVKLLQTIANSKKKKRRPKLESRDSMATDASNSVKPSKEYKAGASSDSEIIMNPEKYPSLKVLCSLKKQHNVSRTLNKNSLVESAGLQLWDSEFSKYFTATNNILGSEVKKTESKTDYSFITCTEQQVQTTEVCTPKTIKALEKYVQTDFPLVTWISSVLNEEKIAIKYIEKGTNTEISNDEDLSNRTDRFNTNVKLIHDTEHQNILSSVPSNILDINEIDAIINSLLYSPLKMLQCKHINKPLGGNIGNSTGFVNLIIRQSDFLPILVSGIEQRKEKIYIKLVPGHGIFLAYIYHVKQTTSSATFKCGERFTVPDNKEKICSGFPLDQYSFMDDSNKVGKTEYSLQYKNTEIHKKPLLSNTLQIDYKNPQTSGRIVLTEFGNSQLSSQSEMISRILTHLIGLPNSPDKNQVS